MIADLIPADVGRRLITDVRTIPREVIPTRRGNILKRSGPVGINRRQPPAGRNTTQKRFLEIRHFENRSEIEQLATIAQTITSAAVPVANVGIGNRRVGAGLRSLVVLERSDAMGPGIVGSKRDAFSSPLADFKQHTVVARFAAALDLDEIGHVSSSIVEIN